MERDVARMGREVDDVNGTSVEDQGKRIEDGRVNLRHRKPENDAS